MKWLEVIELRAGGSHQKMLESHLPALIDEIEKATGKQTIKFYHHAMIESDFSIHLCHDSTKGEKNASPLGLQLASALKEFGMVNHSLWIEMPGQMPHGRKGKNRNTSETLHAEQGKLTERR